MRRKLLTATVLALALSLAVIPVAFAGGNSCNSKDNLTNRLAKQYKVTNKDDLLNKINSLTGKNVNLTELRKSLDTSKIKNASSLKDLLAKFKAAKKVETPKATEKPAPAPKPTAAPQPSKAPAPAPAPTTKPEPTQAPKPATSDVTYASKLEQDMVAMVNEERAKEGLAPLKIDAKLTEYARKHSVDMANNNFFSHTSPTNGSFSERIRNSGISYRSAGENIARYGDVAKAHVGLMNSEGHRANIMGNFTHIGIGIVWDDDMNAYSITQWFATLN